MLIKSSDNGKTWSAPSILNSQISFNPVTGNPARFYGVGPGRGIETSTGRLIFPCYEWHPEYTSVIYSDDKGNTWQRSPNMVLNSSEAAIVEVNSTLYLFTRHGGYYVSKDFGETWSSRKSLGMVIDTGCQISAIKYSKTIDNKPAILLSAPSATRRINGKIFVGLVQEDDSIVWKYDYSVTKNSAPFAYSCLTEQSDGSIGILYEYAEADVKYENIKLNSIVGPAIIDGKRVVEVELYNNFIEEVAGTGPSDAELFLANSQISTIVKKHFSKNIATLGNNSTYQGEEVELASLHYTFEGDTVTGFSAYGANASVYLDPSRRVNGTAGYPFNTTKQNLVISNSTIANNFYIQGTTGEKSFLYFWRDGKNIFDKVGNVGNLQAQCSFMLFRPLEEGEVESSEIKSYYKIKNLSEIASSKQYIIVANVGGQLYFVNPSQSSASKYHHVAKYKGNSESCKISYHGNKIGETNYIYNGITVLIRVVMPSTKNLSLKVGESLEFSLENVQILKDSNQDIAIGKIINKDLGFTVNGVSGNIGTSNQFNGEEVALATALYQIEGDQANGYTIASPPRAGNRIYLSSEFAPAGFPNGKSAKKVSIVENGNGEFYMRSADSSAPTGNRYLYFWRDAQNVFDRVDKLTGFEAACSFEIFRIANEGETGDSLLGGYIKLNSASEIQSGNWYLVAAVANNNYYLSYPSLDTNNKYSHVLKHNSSSTKNIYKVQIDEQSLKITGVAKGKTDLLVGSIARTARSYNPWVVYEGAKLYNISVTALEPTPTVTTNETPNPSPYPTLSVLPSASPAPTQSQVVTASPTQVATINAPKTGDDNPLVLWLVLLSVAIMAGAMNIVKQKHDKSKKDNDSTSE